MAERFGDRFSTIKVAMELKSTETIKQAVIAGMGIVFVSAHTVTERVRAVRSAPKRRAPSVNRKRNRATAAQPPT